MGGGLAADLLGVVAGRSHLGDDLTAPGVVGWGLLGLDLPHYVRAGQVLLDLRLIDGFFKHLVGDVISHGVRLVLIRPTGEELVRAPLNRGNLALHVM